MPGQVPDVFQEWRPLTMAACVCRLGLAAVTVCSDARRWPAQEAQSTLVDAERASHQHAGAETAPEGELDRHSRTTLVVFTTSREPTGAKKPVNSLRPDVDGPLTPIMTPSTMVVPGRHS